MLLFILGYFLHFYLPNSPKHQNLEKVKKKNPWRYHHFTIVYQKSWSYAILLVRYGTWGIKLFFILGHFLPFFPTSYPNNHNLKYAITYKGWRRLIFAFWRHLAFQKFCWAWGKPEDKYDKAKPYLHGNWTIIILEYFVMNYFSRSSGRF